MAKISLLKKSVIAIFSLSFFMTSNAWSGEQDSKSTFAAALQHFNHNRNMYGKILCMAGLIYVARSVAAESVDSSDGGIESADSICPALLDPCWQVTEYGLRIVQQCANECYQFFDLVGSKEEQATLVNYMPENCGYPKHDPSALLQLEGQINDECKYYLSSFGEKVGGVVLKTWELCFKK